MQIGAVGPVLPGFVIGPDEQKSFCWDRVTRWNAKHEFVREVIREVIISKINGVRRRIIQLEPIVKMAVSGVGESFCITCHPFVDEDC